MKRFKSSPDGWKMFCEEILVMWFASRRLFSKFCHPRIVLIRCLTLALAFVAMVGEASAGKIYSYVDESGVKIFSNLGGTRVDTETLDEIEGPNPGHNFAPLISRYASKYGLERELIQSVIRVESNFDPTAVSVKNCKGLMQLHPDTARRFGVRDIFDPAQNIEGGTRYLRYLLDYFEGDLDSVLAAYNAGENSVVRHKGIPPFRETQEYVKKVRQLYRGNADRVTPKARQAPRIVRVVQPDGGILLTNVPAGAE